MDEHFPLPPALLEGFQKLVSGEFSYRLPRTFNRDDQDAVAFLFNSVADELDRIVQTAQVREQELNRVVESISEVLVQVAAGDFKVQVERDYQSESLGESLDVLVYLINTTISELDLLITQNEQRNTEMAKHAANLETVVKISNAVTTILNTQELLQTVADLTKQKFDLYHVHIYLLNESGDMLTLTAGAGKAGRRLVEQGNAIPFDSEKSIVARAARTRQDVLVSDVQQAPDFQPNALLPDTRAEMAIPIVFGVEEKVLGVLNVHENEVGGLAKGDANLLRLLANQVAVAMRNASLFDEVETALAKARAAQERYIAKSWNISKPEMQNREHLYMQPGTVELSAATFEAARDQALAQERPAIVPIDEYEGGSKPLVAPVSLAGQIIGSLQLHKTDSEDTTKLWTEQDFTFVETILDQVAQTAENLRLFEETQERAGREQTIRQITDKLRAAPDLNTLVNVAARELGEQLGVPHLMFELGREPESSPKPGLSGNGE